MSVHSRSTRYVDAMLANPFDTLLTAREHLREASSALAPSSSMLVPDLAFIGFTQDLLRNADSVVALTTAHPPLHATPSARATFEAAQHLLMLVTSDEPAYAGALAYTYGLLKDRDIAEEHADMLEKVPSELGGLGWADSAIQEIASVWEDLAPGRGQLIDKARAELESRWRKKPDHWSGLNPSKALSERIPRIRQFSHTDKDDVSRMLRRAYQALNRETHARAIVRPTAVNRKEDGSLHTTLELPNADSGARGTAWVTASALRLGLVAAQVRPARWGAS